jgi:hypothetical protein
MAARSLIAAANFTVLQTILILCQTAGGLQLTNFITGSRNWIECELIN